MRDERGLLQALLGDGRFLLILTGLFLVFFGAFALFLSATGHFLPHDVKYLGMTAEELCAYHDCRIVHFMFHDRVAFGGTLLAVGLLYLWLAEFPLKQRLAWAWWAFVVSGVLGFSTFLTYLGYGYLDTWHGVGTLLILPCFLVGLIRSFSLLQPPRSIQSLLQRGAPTSWRSSVGAGYVCLLFTAFGLIAGGVTIMTVGVTRVFVPEDLDFMRLAVADLDAISPRLVPLIAHDRAGFGGAAATIGITMWFSIWCGTPSRSLWQILCLSGAIAFACASGVHFVIGYVNFVHLLPVYLGAVLFSAGLVLTYRPMMQSGGRKGID